MNIENIIHHENEGCNASDLQSKRRLPAPQKIRRGESREGGFIIIERTSRKRLLRASVWPVEVASLAEAVIAARRMQGKYPEREFCIFEQVGSFTPSADA